MNGHFAAVGDEPTAQKFEHGIQVIDEDKIFK
jgi:protein SEY1